MTHDERIQPPGTLATRDVELRLHGHAGARVRWSLDYVLMPEELRREFHVAPERNRTAIASGTLDATPAAATTGDQR
jgi:hypothetical protein